MENIISFIRSVSVGGIMITKRFRSSSSFYVNHEISGKCIKATSSGNKYSHYCPIPDFLDISRLIFKKLQAQESVKPLEIENSINGKELSSGRIYRKGPHSYKLTLTLFVLVNEGIIKKSDYGKYTQAENFNQREKTLEIISAEFNKCYRS